MVLQQRYQVQLNQGGEIHKAFRAEDLAALVTFSDLNEI